MRKLARTVHVPNPDTGLREQFLAGTTPPDWAAAAITNPSVWESAEADTASASSGGEPERPPTSGTGSGRKVWAAYAAGLGIDVDEAMSRDDIVEAVDAHEHADTEPSEADTESEGDGEDA